MTMWNLSEPTDCWVCGKSVNVVHSRDIDPNRVVPEGSIEGAFRDFYAVPCEHRMPKDTMIRVHADGRVTVGRERYDVDPDRPWSDEENGGAEK